MTNSSKPENTQKLESSKKKGSLIIKKGTSEKIRVIKNVRNDDITFRSQK